MAEKTKGEAQYQPVIELIKHRPQRLGVSSGWGWYDDPKRLAFCLSRYKFVSKMLQGRERALEVGCGDGFYSRIVRQAVGSLVAVDFDADFIASAKEVMDERWTIDFRLHDMLEGGVAGSFDAIYSLDVFEHIPAEQEDLFLRNLTAPLERHGVVIIGAPSLESQAYASQISKDGHVNCKSQEDFRKVLQKHFHTVFMFSMNDEVVHTGFSRMSHYNIGLCCERV